MKKNFFKKLSFVLALAMIVSVIYPAAGALAATKAPKFNKSKVYLYLDGKDEFDFNVLNKGGRSVEYVSANEDVAVVDDKGVATAVGIGRTTIDATLYSKKGVEYKTIKATVVVRDNVAELDVSNLPKDKVKVGVAHDFDVTFKTESGSTDATSSYIAWEVLKDGKATELATIDADGNFVATEAGKFEVVARAFQTVDGHKLFVKDSVANAKYVLDDAKAEVEVAISITAIKLLTPSQFKITFDSSVKGVVDGKEDVKVNQILKDDYTAMIPVLSFDSISEDGKEVVVSTYENLADKTTYKVATAGASFDLYAQIGTPVDISLNDQTVPAGVATTIAYSLVDQFGVNVASIYGDAVLKNGTVPVVNGKITLADGQVAFVEFIYTIVNTDGTIKEVRTGQKTVKGSAATVGGVIEWNINGNGTYDESRFWAADKDIKVDETGRFLYARVKRSDNTYNYGYLFESLNQGILMVNRANGAMTAISEGTALVKVIDGTNFGTVGYIYVPVVAKSNVATIKADKPVVRLSNDITVGLSSSKVIDTITVNILQVDQYGVETAATIQEQYPANATKFQDIATVTSSGNSITFTANANKAGTFSYLVKANDKYATINVTVAAPGLLTNYDIVPTAAKIDGFDANTAWPHTPSTVDFTVYGVDASGYKKQVAVSGSGLTVSYKVTGPNNYSAVLTDGDLNGTVTYAIDDAVPATNVAPGVYTLTVTIGGINYTKTFEIVNTRPTPSFKKVKIATEVVNNSANLLDAVEDMLELTDSSNAHVAITNVEFVTNNSTIIANNGIDFLTTGTVTIYVTKIHYNDGIARTMDVNAPLTITVK